MSLRLAPLLLGALLLSACGGKNKRPPTPPAAAPTTVTQPGPASEAEDPCAVIYEHDEADYVPGGLYRAGQRDSGPARAPDLSRIPEPVPRAEPRARYGNRSPYTVLGRSYHVLPSADGYVERGIASWYGQKFHGRPTSSLEPYDMCAFTAAHKTLPLPSYVRVTNLDNGASVIVRVNDRGPFHDGRIIDLSYVAALRLGIHARGTGRVEVRAIDVGEGGASVRQAAAAAPPAAGNGALWLQVGSFGERDNARRVAAQLRAAGIGPVRNVRVTVGERRFWRVRIGPLADAGSMDATRARVRALGLGDPHPVSP